jgi:hypothetical protein
MIVEKAKIEDLRKTAEGLIILIITDLKIEVKLRGEIIKIGDIMQIGEVAYITNYLISGKLS